MKKSVLLDGGLPLKPTSTLLGMFVACCVTIWIAPCAVVVCLLRPKDAQRIGTAFIAVIEAVKST